MASIRDYAVTIYAAVTASMVCEMPVHATGDLLVAFVNKDSASNFTTPSGWTAQQTQVSVGAGGGVYTKRAASASETVTFALTSETCCAVVIAVKDCNGSTEADAVSGSAKSGANDSTLPFAGSGMTPSHDNCLILHGLSTDGGIGATALPPWVNLFAGDAGANSLCVSYSHQKTAAAITAPNHWAGAADDTRGFIIAIRPHGTTDSFDAYLPLSTTPATQLSALSGTQVIDLCTYISGASIAITSVAGKTVSGVTGGALADSGVNPFRASMTQAGVSSTTLLSHAEINLDAALDATALRGLMFGTYVMATPRDYIDLGRPAQGGVYILAGSNTTNWRAWVVGGQFSKTTSVTARNNYLIDLGASDTIYASAGTPNFAALDYLAFGSSGYYGAPAIRWNELYLLGEIILAGGSTSSHIDFDDIIFAVNNGCSLLPIMQQAGALATLWAPLRFGGTDPIHVTCELNTFQYPRKADEISYVDFHVPLDAVGIEFYGLSGDTLNFKNCLFTSPTSYYWRFHASHNAGASINFSGSSVVGASVTLRATSDLDRVTFIKCSSFTQNSATLTNCSFQGTKVSSATPADAALISDCDFTSSGTGHAIEISGTAANFTLDGVTFTGYSGTSTDAPIYVNIASGSMTISITGGGTTPTIRTAGATVTVVNAVTVKITVKDVNTGAAIENARVLIEAAAGGDLGVGVDILSGVTDSSGIIQTTSFAFTNNQPVAGRARRATVANGTLYKTSPITGTITAAGLDITVLLIPD